MLQPNFETLNFLGSFHMSYIHYTFIMHVHTWIGDSSCTHTHDCVCILCRVSCKGTNLSCLLCSISNKYLCISLFVFITNFTNCAVFQLYRGIYMYPHKQYAVVSTCTRRKLITFVQAIYAKSEAVFPRLIIRMSFFTNTFIVFILIFFQ